MAIRLGHILPILAAGVAILPLSACQDWDDFGRLVEGKPTKAQVRAEAAPSVVYYVSPASVEVVEAVAVEPAKIACVPPSWRLGHCDADTGEIVWY